MWNANIRTIRSEKEMVLASLFYACIIGFFFLYTLDIVKLVSYQMQWTKIDIVAKVRNVIPEPLLYKSWEVLHRYVCGASLSILYQCRFLWKPMAYMMVFFRGLIGVNCTVKPWTFLKYCFEATLYAPRHTLSQKQRIADNFV